MIEILISYKNICSKHAANQLLPTRPAQRQDYYPIVYAYAFFAIFDLRVHPFLHCIRKHHYEWPGVRLSDVSAALVRTAGVNRSQCR
jgi:hypothetical protein